MSEKRQDHMYCELGGEPKALHVWMRINDYPASKATFVCTSCCMLVHHLAHGRSAMGRAEYVWT